MSSCVVIPQGSYFLAKRKLIPAVQFWIYFQIKVCFTKWNSKLSLRFYTCIISISKLTTHVHNDAAINLLKCMFTIIIIIIFSRSAAIKQIFSNNK